MPVIRAAVLVAYNAYTDRIISIIRFADERIGKFLQVDSSPGFVQTLTQPGVMPQNRQHPVNFHDELRAQTSLLSGIECRGPVNVAVGGCRYRQLHRQ